MPGYQNIVGGASNKGGQVGTIGAANAAVTVARILTAGGVGVQLVGGTFSGTVTFEATLDGSHWNALALTPVGGGSAVTTATAAGQWQGAVVATQIRARVSSYTSGSLVATLLYTAAGV